MRIFNADAEYRWDEKVNFVDNNNVFVGYDMGQDCCEHASWFISATDHNSMPESELLENKDYPNIEDYSFDPTFYQERDLNASNKDSDYGELDEGEAVAFRLTNTDGAEAFLYLFNSHNGYYGHGFEFKINEEIVKDGCL